MAQFFLLPFASFVASHGPRFRNCKHGSRSILDERQDVHNRQNQHGSVLYCMEWMERSAAPGRTMSFDMREGPQLYD